MSFMHSSRSLHGIETDVSNHRPPSETKKLKKNFRVILVGGFGAKEHEVKEAAWQLCSIIYDLPPSFKNREYDKVKSIVDTSTSLIKVEPRDVEKLLESIISTGEHEDGMTCVLIAHSHGAKIAARALEEERMRDFYRRNLKKMKDDNTPHHNSNGSVTLDDDMASKMVQRTRQNMAVFTIGGIENLEPTCAKVCVNIQLAADSKSYLGKKLFGGQSQGSTELLSDSKEAQPYDGDSWSTAAKTFWRNTFNLASARSQKHTLRDYFTSDRVTDFILQRLPLQKDDDCDCCKGLK